MQKGSYSQAPALYTGRAILANMDEYEHVYEHVNVTMSTLVFAPLCIAARAQAFNLSTVA